MPSFSHDETAHMQAAIDASAQAVQLGNMPFGATLVKDGQRLQVSRNEQVTSGDCMAHAEVVLVRDAVRRLGAHALKGATVYASGEPCAMCCGTLFWAGIRRVVYAASTQDINAALGEPSLSITSRNVLGTASPHVQVDGPLLDDAAILVLQSFAKAQAGAS